jgi:hypothetical protein
MWTPSFVVPLVGEYVIEILELIRDNLLELNRPLYRQFLLETLASSLAPSKESLAIGIATTVICIEEKTMPAFRS